jgi:hypothetical protein
MKQLMLFGTLGCHLCEDAESIVKDCLPGRFEQMVELIDIAEQEQWQERYAIRIPVLYHPETQKELGWPFDQAELAVFIRALKIDA